MLFKDAVYQLEFAIVIKEKHAHFIYLLQTNFCMLLTNCQMLDIGLHLLLCWILFLFRWQLLAKQRPKSHLAAESC